MTVLRLIIVFLIAIVMVAVVVANLDTTTTLKLVAGTLDNVSLALVLVIAWGFGLLSYAIFALLGEIRLRNRLARQKREFDLLTRELNDLRNLPLSGDDVPVQSEGAGETAKEPS